MIVGNPRARRRQAARAGLMLGARNAAIASLAKAAYTYGPQIAQGAYRTVKKWWERPSYSARTGYSMYSRAYVPKRTKGKKLSVKVRALEKKLKDETSLIIYKYDDKDTLRATSSSTQYGYKSAVSNATIELALAQARFFDPANPGTLITASLASPTFTQKCLISCYSALYIQNNYQVPCVVTYGVAFPRVDTSISPNSALSQGLADCGNPDATSVLINFKDSQEFNRLWRVKLITKRLKPGQMVKLVHKQKGFTYDPSFIDSHTLTYQRETKSAVFVYRVQGVLGHDTSVATEQGFLGSGVDINVRSVYRVHYNSGGASVKTIVLNENSTQTFTNAGVVSEQPVADNVSYSVS